MKRFLVGVDIGTSGTKAAVTNAQGVVLGSAAEGYPLYSPKPGWAEQDAEDWGQAVYNTVRAAVKEAGINPADVGGICVSGLFAGSGVPVDGLLRPLRKAIIWMDRRAVQQQEWAEERLGKKAIFTTSGNTNDAYFGFNKMLWLRQHEPEIWHKTRYLLSSNGYVVACLTGRVTMDVTSAANIGGIYNWEKQCWDKAALCALGLPAEKLPTGFLSPVDIAGTLTSAAAERCGLVPGIAVCAGCTDCLASVLAAGVVEEGTQSAIIGTSINWAMLHRAKPEDPRLVSMPFAIEPARLTYTYGGVTSAGALSEWFLANCAPYTSAGQGPVATTFAMLDKEAAAIPPGSEGLLVLPYFMGERSPVWDAGARGVFCGLSLHHTRAHMWRAILESLAFAARHIRETSAIFSGADTCVVSGGACKSALWMQIIADVTGLTLVPTGKSVQAPVGDALIAGVATGLVPSFAAAKQWCSYGTPVKPNPAPKKQYDAAYSLYKRLYGDTRGVIHGLG